MWKKLLKKSSWTDLIISLIFILLGLMMIARPELVMSTITIILGMICIVKGIFKITDYLAGNKQDNYLLAIAIIFIIIGIIIMFCSEFILSAFRILIAIWVIYSGIMNLQTIITWKEYTSRIWLTTLILAIVMICAGIYILVNNGAILQSIGIAIIIYGLIDIIENIIFIKKVDNYLD